MWTGGTRPALRPDCPNHRDAAIRVQTPIRLTTDLAVKALDRNAVGRDGRTYRLGGLDPFRSPGRSVANWEQHRWGSGDGSRRRPPPVSACSVSHRPPTRPTPRRPS